MHIHAVRTHRCVGQILISRSKCCAAAAGHHPCCPVISLPLLAYNTLLYLALTYLFLVYPAVLVNRTCPTRRTYYFKTIIWPGSTCTSSLIMGYNTCSCACSVWLVCSASVSYDISLTGTRTIIGVFMVLACLHAAFRISTLSLLACCCWQ